MNRPCQYSDYKTPDGGSIPTICVAYNDRCCGKPGKAKAWGEYWVCAEHFDIIEARLRRPAG